MWHKDPNTQFVEPGDTTFWNNFWRTDAFRALLDDPSTGYASMMARVAERPWWFITPTQDYERKHFAPWFAQSFIKREYENKVVEDLYYWHDIVHAMTFIDASRLDEASWRLGMRANEINTSMETEVLIYWRAPHLRSQTFDHPIWFDALNKGEDEQSRSRLRRYLRSMGPHSFSFEAEHERALRASLPPSLLPYQFPNNDRVPDFDTLWAMRRATTLLPREGNFVEEELARYEASADPFYSHWEGLWHEVECARAEFATLCSEGRWREAVKRREAQWERVANKDGVPYGDMASSFVI